MDCNLCLPSAWSGPDCPQCSLHHNFHYLEGDSGGVQPVSFFCVVDSPSHPAVSGRIAAHAPWTIGIELTIKKIIEEYKQKLDKTFANLHTRYTYAIRCAKDKPVRDDILSCTSLFHKELLDYASPDIPIFVLAMGAAPLVSLGFKVKKISDFQSRFFRTKLQEKEVVVFSTFSRRDLSANPGRLDVFKDHVYKFLSAVRDAKDGKNVKVECAVDTIMSKYIFPKTVNELRKLADEIVTYAPEGTDIKRCPLAIDTETNTLLPYRDRLKILTFTVAWGPEKAASVPVEHFESYFKFEEVSSFIHRVLTCAKPKVFQNAKFDLQVLRRKGFEVTNFAWDTMLGEHLLEEDKKGYYGLKDIVRKRLPEYSNYEDALHDWLVKNPEESPKEAKKKHAEKRLAEDNGYERVPLSILNPYGAMDVDVTRQIAILQIAAINEEDTEIYQKYRSNATSPYLRNNVMFSYRKDHALSPKPIMGEQLVDASKVLAEMELTGVPVDREYVEKLYKDLNKSIMDSQIAISKMVPPSLFEKFNPKSTHHLRTVLFNTGFRQPTTGEVICYKGKIKPSLTPTGAESVDAAFLKRLVTEQACPLAKEVLIYRAMNKAVDPFVSNIRALSREDGRMHTTYNIPGTSTGRLCVAEDTVIPVHLGSVVISRINLKATPELFVTTHLNRFRRIKNVFYKGEEEMYRVTREDGEYIDVTKGHRFFTPEGVEHLRDLNVGSLVTTGRLTEYSRVHTISSIGVKGVWDIEVEEDHSYVAQGFVNHNSSSGENLQNIPAFIGKHNIKKIFVPADRANNVFVNVDAKAAEVRIYAAYSNDANLIKALKEGLDPHSFFSSMVYSPATITTGIPASDHQHVLELIGIDGTHAWSYDDFQSAGRLIGSDEKPGADPVFGKRLKILRNNIKRVVFGILYGASKGKISSIVGIPNDQAQAIIDALFKMFPSIPVYIARTKEHLEQFHVVETFFGRRRRFDMKNLTSKLKAEVERKAINFKIQSTSSDIVIRVLNSVAPIIKNDLHGQVLITVHDSIGMELPKKYVSQIPELFDTYGVKKIATECPWLPVPFKWEVEVGPSYGELQSIEEYLGSVPHKGHDELEFVEGEIKQQLAAAAEG